MASKGEPERPPRRAYVSRLNTPEACQRALSRVAREALRGERGALEAARIGRLIFMAAKLLEIQDFERQRKLWQEAA